MILKRNKHLKYHLSLSYLKNSTKYTPYIIFLCEKTTSSNNCSKRMIDKLVNFPTKVLNYILLISLIFYAYKHFVIKTYYKNTIIYDLLIYYSAIIHFG